MIKFSDKSSLRDGKDYSYCSSQFQDNVHHCGRVKVATMEVANHITPTIKSRHQQLDVLVLLVRLLSPLVHSSESPLKGISSENT